MILMNRRCQHAVGQGGFHTASLSDDESVRLRYVYDCGAMQKYADEREERVDGYISHVGVGQTLDLLFISHVHADHVNGVEQLLGATGLKVDTIVLPLVNVIDRIIAFARTATEDSGAASSEFYRTFVVSPTLALSRFDPRQIIYVEPGERDGGGAPGFDGDPPERGPPSDLSGQKHAEYGPSWRLVGPGQIDYNDPTVIDPDDLSRVVPTALIPDSMAMLTQISGRSWLLAPFVDPTIASHTNTFLASLAKRLKMSKPVLRSWLKKAGNVETLLTAKLSDLVGAYGDVAKDLNLTSMSLFSGPAPPSTPAVRMAFAQFGAVAYDPPAADDLRIGWLATGDAALAQESRREALLKHYGHLLGSVMTLVLPHHGSDHNFDPALLVRVEPKLCLAAADRFSTWKHPGPHAIQSVASRGMFLQVVTSKRPSETFELVTIV